MAHAAAPCPLRRLHWGEAGTSNALAIAEGLGFSRQVVHAARKVHPLPSLAQLLLPATHGQHTSDITAMEPRHVEAHAAQHVLCPAIFTMLRTERGKTEQCTSRKPTAWCDKHERWEVPDTLPGAA